MILSQEDNSSPALMSRVFNFYLATVSILETTQKNPHTLRRPSLSVRIFWIVKGIKKLSLLYPILHHERGDVNILNV